MSDKELTPLAAAASDAPGLMTGVGLSPSLDRPWVARYEPGVPARLASSDAAFPEVLAGAAASAPTLPGLSYFLRRVAYGTLQARVEQVARALVRDGLQPGESLRLALPDCPQWVEAALGALTAGAVVDLDGSGPEAAVVVASPWRLSDPRLADAASRARRVVLVDPARELSFQQRAIVALARLGRRNGLPRGLQAASWSAWLGRRDRETVPMPELGPEHHALWVGGRCFRHRHLIAGAAQLRAWLVDAAAGDETWLLLTPLESQLGFVSGLGAAFALRARVALLPDWQPEDVTDAVRFLRPTWVVASGEAVERLARDARLERADLRSVRGWLVGDPLPPAAARAFEDTAGLELCRGWAPPHAAGLATLQPINGAREVDSVGLPLPGVDVTSGAGRLTFTGPNLVEDDAPSVPGRVDGSGWVRLGG
jgi:long-chain acyl-CoA synthetase